MKKANSWHSPSGLVTMEVGSFLAWTSALWLVQFVQPKALLFERDIYSYSDPSVTEGTRLLEKDVKFCETYFL